MKTDTQLNPLVALAKAIRDLDHAYDEMERHERNLLEAQSEAEQAKTTADKAYKLAKEQGPVNGKQIPDAYQYSETLVRFDQKEGVLVTRAKFGSTFELERWAEPEQPGSSE